MSCAGVKWEKADKYHKNDNYNSAVLEWEAEAMNYHGLTHGQDHNLIIEWDITFLFFPLLFSLLVCLQMVCWGCFWSGCLPNLSCCKPGLLIFGRCSMMPGNPGARLRMRLTLTIWPEMNSTSRKWWWWSPLQERWGHWGRNSVSRL